MDYSNKDLLKLISEILEYTENSTPSDSPPPSSPPPCKCKIDGGNCGDDTSTCQPKPDGTYDIVSCTCPNGNTIFCPKCPNSCECKTDGGVCGDDPSDCPDAPRPLSTVDCYDSKGLVCNVCPICPPVTPTSSPTICNCLDCGLWSYKRDDSCWKEDCKCSYGNTNSSCWYCPSTNTPTSTCDTSGCICDAGTRCDICELLGEECINQAIQICGNDINCTINCGNCVPKSTPSPTPSSTDTPTDTTSLCPCNCSEFDSMAQCEDFVKRKCVGMCYCHEATCDGQDCYTNQGCANVKDYPPTPTPTPTITPTPSCPGNCSKSPCNGYASGSGCSGCTKNSQDYCINCIPDGDSCTVNINGFLCPTVLCDYCEHVPKKCSAKNAGYSKPEDCETALINLFSPLDATCEPCFMDQTCTDGTPNKEPCYCIVPIPTGTPTICKCSDFVGYADSGECPAGKVGPVSFDCSNYGLGFGLIDCDQCITPTPSPTCNCTNPDIISPNICFSTEPDCKSYAQTAKFAGQDCVCNSKNFTCPTGNSISCTCATCQPFTPSPTPTPSVTPTPSCPPGCCKSEAQAAALTANKCVDYKCCYYVPYITADSNSSCTCWSVQLIGSALTLKPVGYVMQGNNCVSLGSGCTSAVERYTKCDILIYPIQKANGNDGAYSVCS